MKIELEDLWVCEIATRNLKPILDPLTIKVKIINKAKGGDVLNDIDIKMNRDISNNSNLSNIIIIFFRHQHILIILIMIMVFMILILEFSTSKVDILLNY